MESGERGERDNVPGDDLSLIREDRHIEVGKDPPDAEILKGTGQIRLRGERFAGCGERRTGRQGEQRSREAEEKGTWKTEKREEEQDPSRDKKREAKPSLASRSRNALLCSATIVP
jgi:hypothetical protein